MTTCTDPGLPPALTHAESVPEPPPSTSGEPDLAKEWLQVLRELACKLTARERLLQLRQEQLEEEKGLFWGHAKPGPWEAGEGRSKSQGMSGPVPAGKKAELARYKQVEDVDGTTHQSIRLAPGHWILFDEADAAEYRAMQQAAVQHWSYAEQVRIPSAGSLLGSSNCPADCSGIALVGCYVSWWQSLKVTTALSYVSSHSPSHESHRWTVPHIGSHTPLSHLPLTTDPPRDPQVRETGGWWRLRGRKRGV